VLVSVGVGVVVPVAVAVGVDASVISSVDSELSPIGTFSPSISSWPLAAT